VSRSGKPFDTFVVDEETDAFASLSRKPSALAHGGAAPPAVSTARFHGFDVDDRPLVAAIAGLAGEILPARSTVPLLHGQIGSDVVLLFENDDVRRPIIIGVLKDRPCRTDGAANAPVPLVSVQGDDDRLVISAEREVILRCGEASITLTRAGKVIIKGRYVLSRATGCNRIKGAAVDIN
jgi:hypothetical protein